MKQTQLSIHFINRLRKLIDEMNEAQSELSYEKNVIPFKRKSDLLTLIGNLKNEISLIGMAAKKSGATEEEVRRIIFGK